MTQDEKILMAAKLWNYYNKKILPDFNINTNGTSYTIYGSDTDFIVFKDRIDLYIKTDIRIPFIIDEMIDIEKYEHIFYTDSLFFNKKTEIRYNVIMVDPYTIDDLNDILRLFWNYARVSLNNMKKQKPSACSTSMKTIINKKSVEAIIRTGPLTRFKPAYQELYQLILAYDISMTMEINRPNRKKVTIIKGGTTIMWEGEMDSNFEFSAQMPIIVKQVIGFLRDDKIDEILG